jgi:hypothetical protein
MHRRINLVEHTYSDASMNVCSWIASFLVLFVAYGRTRLKLKSGTKYKNDFLYNKNIGEAGISPYNSS